MNRPGLLPVSPPFGLRTIKDGEVTETQASRTVDQDRDVTEIRLALVMNGGVSLAVWMGGVVHELDIVCRASRSLGGHADDTNMTSLQDQPVFDQWRRLLERTRRRVRVDIVSGTSAGGLNGLLLATAIGRGRPLPNLRKMWKTSADLKLLLGQKGRGEDEARSVFNGQFFRDQIAESIAAIGQQAGSEDVTLFVTATSLDGQPRRFKDGFDQQFDVRDHRRVYRFTNQQGIENVKYVRAGPEGTGAWEFTPDERREFTDDPALVLAARATASYPLAFPPVSEDPLLDYRVFPERGCRGHASSVMDGGVLNNAPFGPVLDEIARRPLENRPVERVLVYVVPSAGHLTEERAKDDPSERINPVTVVTSALNYPQEADFRSSADDLDQRLRSSVRSTREDLFARMLPGHDDPVKERAAHELARKVSDSSSSLLCEYRRNRVRAVIIDTLSPPTSATSVTAMASPPEFSDETIDELLAMKLSWCPPESGTAVIKPDLTSWQWGGSAAERLLTTLTAYLNRLLLPFHEHPTLDTAPQARTRLVHQAREVHRHLRHVLAAGDALAAERQRLRRAEGETGPLEAAHLVERCYQDLNLPKVLGEHVRGGAKAFLAALELTGSRWPQPEDLVSALLGIEVLTVSFVPAANAIIRPTPSFKFLRLGPDSMGQLFREDWSADIGDKKLYGIRFRHFGAFINCDWRSSDFAWGRLDAAHHLLPLLLPDDDTGQERDLHRLILTEEAYATEDDGNDPVEAMKKQLKTLAGTADADLLHEPEIALLRETGTTALDILLPHGAVSWNLRRIWNLTWRRWRREAGRTPRSILHEAKWATTVVIGLWGAALLTAGLLLGWWLL